VKRRRKRRRRKEEEEEEEEEDCYSITEMSIFSSFPKVGSV
jgi:hypothetical protein